MYGNSYPSKRKQQTLAFIKRHSKPCSILDLGVRNPFSEILKNEGYQVKNTKGEDLHFNRSEILKSNSTVTTAFEIFKHLLSPFEVTRYIQSEYLFTSAPLGFGLNVRTEILKVQEISILTNLKMGNSIGC